MHSSGLLRLLLTLIIAVSTVGCSVPRQKISSTIGERLTSKVTKGKKRTTGGLTNKKDLCRVLPSENCQVGFRIPNCRSFEVCVTGKDVSQPRFPNICVTKYELLQKWYKNCPEEVKPKGLRYDPRLVEKNLKKCTIVPNAVCERENEDECQEGTNICKSFNNLDGSIMQKYACNLNIVNVSPCN